MVVMVGMEGEGGRDPRTSLDYVYVVKSVPMDRPHGGQVGGLYGVIEDGPTEPH